MDDTISHTPFRPSSAVLRASVACGVDVGTTNLKVVALDLDGVVVARARRRTPRDIQGVSIDARALVEAVEEMVVEVCGDSFRVGAVCAAGVGEDGILVDSGLEPLTDALAWFDPRRRGIFQTLRPLLHADESFDADTDPARTIVGWQWSRMQDPDRAGSSWVAVADLASTRWTGRPFLSDTLASRTGAWRADDRRWADDRVAVTLGSSDLLPAVVAAGETLGSLDSPALRSAGVVAADAIVVAGGHDHAIAGWGVDQLEPGAVVDSMGTAEVVVAQVASSTRRRQHGVDVAPGIRSSGRTLLFVEEISRNVEWASQDPEVARCIRGLLDGSVRAVAVLDSGYFLPGRPGGGQPSYALDAPGEPLVRASAVLGALAHAGRDAVDAVRLAAGEDRVVRLTGGWARSRGWVDIKDAVNGYHAEGVLESEVTAVSAALLAARAYGWNPDPVRAFSGTGAVR